MVTNKHILTYYPREYGLFAGPVEKRVSAGAIVQIRSQTRYSGTILYTKQLYTFLCCKSTDIRLLFCNSERQCDFIF